MISIRPKKNSRVTRVDPFFIQIAEKYKENFEKEFGFPIPKTQVSKQMAEVFDKMLQVNGMPVLHKKDKPKKRRKVKTCRIFWDFEI